MPRCPQPAKLLPYRVISHKRYRLKNKDLPRLFSREKNFENVKLQNLRILFVPTFVLNLFLVRDAIFEHENFPK